MNSYTEQSPQEICSLRLLVTKQCTAVCRSGTQQQQQIHQLVAPAAGGQAVAGC